MLTLQNYPCDYTLYLEYGKVDCALRESRGYTMSLHLQCINGANQGFLMRGKKISTALGTLSRGIRVRKRMGAGTAPLRCQSVEGLAIRTIYRLRYQDLYRSRYSPLGSQLIDRDFSSPRDWNYVRNLQQKTPSKILEETF